MGYLVLRLKEGQRLRIGRDVRMELSAFQGRRVKVAIEAPRDVAIIKEASRCGCKEAGQCGYVERKDRNGKGDKAYRRDDGRRDKPA